MAAPWTHGRYPQANLAVYLPPGFKASGKTRYPVIYEAPYGISSWIQPGRFDLPSAMDSLIAQRLVPPEIVVLLGTSGGPYLDSECANSFDGRAKIETWIVKTVVPWVDRHYPTVASRNGRAFMGASQGGYCAAAMWSHHLDMFGAAIIESGYFVSGVRSSETVNAWRPFGGNVAYERSQSPILRVPMMAARVRAASLVLLEADPANAFYGTQASAFMAALARARVPFRFYADPLGHTWDAFARDTPLMLVDLAHWMALRGVVG
jgi:enterochelin esterase-like enzyme